MKVTKFGDDLQAKSKKTSVKMAINCDNHPGFPIALYVQIALSSLHRMNLPKVTRPTWSVNLIRVKQLKCSLKCLLRSIFRVLSYQTGQFYAVGN